MMRTKLTERVIIRLMLLVVEFFTLTVTMAEGECSPLISTENMR